MTLLFYVNNQSLSISPTQENIKVASDSKNYLKAKFVFQTKDWKTGLPQYVLFTQNGKTYKKYLGIEEGVQADECFVAPEVIKPGVFSVSVFSDNYISTNKVEISVLDSGYTENIENEKLTPTVMEQMNTLMYKYASICNEILKECQSIQKYMEVNK